MSARFGPEITKVELKDIRSSECFSHLVVLTAIAKLMPVRRVLEIGAGDWSTPFFLNKEAFPDLEYLESYEDSLHWYERVRNLVQHDKRANIVHSGISFVDLTQFDICLIDDNLRQYTVEYVTGNCPDNLIVLIHDFENPDYRNVSPELNRYTVTQVKGPLTCIAWKGQRLNHEFFQQLIKTFEEIE